jgi:prevent-host-death family protein
MKRVGACEAKTHLPRLLQEVARGESIVITKHGVPVARLVPPDGVPRADIEEAIQEIRRFRKGRSLGEASLCDLIEEGRRF